MTSSKCNVWILLAATLLAGAAQAGEGGRHVSNGLACLGRRCALQNQIRYLGEVCWAGQTDEGPAEVRVGATHLGGGHITLNGVIRQGEEAFAVTGNAESIDGAWVLNLLSSGGVEGLALSGSPPLSVDVAGFTVFTMRLDPRTLAGRVLLVDTLGVRGDPPSFPSGVSFGGAVDVVNVPCE